MTKVINVVGTGSNVGKTVLMEGLIKELSKRGLKIATIKHDVHGFDIDEKGKDTYRHRESGSETVIISSKNRFAMIKELDEEVDLEEIIKMITDKDIILVEGYKKSNLRKIEVFREGVSDGLITHKDNLIAIASNVSLNIEDIPVINKDDYIALANLIEEEKEFKIE